MAGTDVYHDEWKQALINRYNDIEWFDDVDKYRCVRCKNVAIINYISNCQHIYCDNCKTIVEDGSAEWKCKQCRQYITQVVEQDVYIDVRIGQLQVCCPNKRYGCQHVDQLRSIFDHLRVCADSKEAKLSNPHKGTNSMNFIYDEVGKINARLREMAEQISTMKDKSEIKFTQINRNSKALDLKVNSKVEELRRDLTGFGADLQVQMVRMNDTQEHFKGNGQDILLEKFKALKKEINSFKTKQKKITKESSDSMLTMKASMDLFIKMLDQKEEKVIQKLSEQEAEFKNAIDYYKEQLKQSQEIVQQQNLKLERMANSITDHKQQLIDLKTQMASMENKLQQSESWINNAIGKSHKDLQEQFTKKLEKKNADAADKLETAKQKTLQIINEVKNDVKQLQHQNEYNEKFYVKKMSEEEMMLMTEVFEWKIKRIKTKLKLEHPIDEYSELFSVPGYSFKAMAQASISKEMIELNLRLFHLNNVKGPIDPTILPSVTYILTDQSDNEEKRKMIASNSFNYNSSYEYEVDILKVNFKTPIALHFIRDNSVKIKILIPPPSIATTLSSRDGVLLWKVSNLTNTKLNTFYTLEEYRVEWDYESPCFYTSANGYKVQILLKLVEESRLKAHLAFLKGKNDEFLCQNFNHRLTITLINQTGQSNNIISSAEENEIENCTSVEIMHYSPFTSNGFIINDSLLLKAVVETVDKIIIN